MGRPHGRADPDGARRRQPGDREQPVRFKLPEREFTKPLARALVEQRRKLVMRPDDRTDVLAMLDALTIWPDDILEESGVYLGLRLAQTQLYRARSDADVKQTIELLWKIAVSIEDGETNDPGAISRRPARRCRKRGARRPSEKIAERCSACAKPWILLTAMMNEARRNQSAEQSQRNRERAAEMRAIDPQDLNRMLDAIEKWHALGPTRRPGAALPPRGTAEHLRMAWRRCRPISMNRWPKCSSSGRDSQAAAGAHGPDVPDARARMEGGEMGQEGMEGREPGMQGSQRARRSLAQQQTSCPDA